MQKRKGSRWLDCTESSFFGMPESEWNGARIRDDVEALVTPTDDNAQEPGSEHDAEFQALLKSAERIQDLATHLLRFDSAELVETEAADATGETLAGAVDVAAKLVEIMSNVAAATDAVSMDEHAARGLRRRLDHLAGTLSRADREQYVTPGLLANVQVALESSRRLVPAHPVTDTVAEDESGERQEEIAAAPSGVSARPQQSIWSRPTFLAPAAVATALVIGAAGFLVGDASDNEGQSSSSSASTTSVEKVATYMSVLDDFRTEWQPTMDELIPLQRALRQEECAGQEQQLTAWPQQLDAVAVSDDALRSAGTRYFVAMREVADDCAGTGLEIRRDYIECTQILREVEARARELGWSRK
jgi:hypothetical protein